MSQFPDRDGTAVLIIDMQNKVLSSAPNRDDVLSAVNTLVDRARSAGTPVIWVQDSLDGEPHDSDAWQIHHQLHPASDEPRIYKDYGDAFEATDLERVLKQLGAGRIVVAGAQTDACIRSTIHGGFTRGYDVTLVSDAHTTEDLTAWGAPPVPQVIIHTNLYWAFQEAPGRSATVQPAAEVRL